VSAARETRCPLCDRPRAPGASRCICNYTFEYDSAPRARGGGGGGARAAGAPIQGGILVLALGAGLAAAMLLGASIEGSPKRPELGLLLIGAGAFAVAGSFFAWGWFFGARKARLVTAVLGLAGARIVYALLGGGLAGAGVAMLIA
jgi:hypothetical protein